MRDESKPDLKAFTLVELLVVIAIISILIAILLPVLQKVRRKAVVLASPIVYYSWRSNALRVCDPKGNYDMEVTPSYGSPGDRRAGRPLWSPSGQKIGFEVNNWGQPNAGPQWMCILNPMSGIISCFPETIPKPRTYFKGWWDDGHFMEATGNGFIYVRDAESGAIINSSPQAVPVAGPFYLVPPNSGGRWVATAQIDINRELVTFVRSDFTYGKPIWLSSLPWRADGEDYPVDVDWLGEWIAWTESDGNTSRTSFKRLGDPSSLEPSHIKFDGYFAQWTEDGNMLFLTGNGMAVLDKSGKLVRAWKVPYGTDSGWASWRHYGHR